MVSKKSKFSKKAKIAIATGSAVACVGLGVAGYFGYQYYQAKDNTTSYGYTSENSVLNQLRKSEHADTVDKELDTSDTDNIINKEPSADEIVTGDAVTDDIYADYHENSGVTALAATDIFSKLISYENMSDKEIKSVKESELNELAFWLVWYSKHPQLASMSGAISSAYNGLDRLALVYERIGKVSPYDVYSNGFKITTDDWNSFKPSDFDDKIKTYREEYAKASEADASISSPSATEVVE